MMTNYPNFSVLLRVALIILLGLRQEGELHAGSNSRDQARSKQSNMLSMKAPLASKSLLACSRMLLNIFLIVSKSLHRHHPPMIAVKMLPSSEAFPTRNWVQPQMEPPWTLLWIRVVSPQLLEEYGTASRGATRLSPPLSLQVPSTLRSQYFRGAVPCYPVLTATM